MNLCQYKDIFGKPNKGVHSYRIFNIAIIDFLLTMIVAFIISYTLNKSFLYCFVLLFIFGIILHKLFCVNTTITKLLFGVLS